MSLTNVDLPEPETPVTQVNSPTGKETLTSFRLLPVAPSTRISCNAPRVAMCSASRAARRTAASLGGKREARGLVVGGELDGLARNDVREPDDFWGQIDRAAALAAGFVRRIRAGDVRHDPRGGECPSWCSYRPICRVRRA